MSQYDHLPDEILLMRRWLAEVFTQAAQGLPWPQQAALRLVEQGLAMGMFGGLLGSACMLQEYRERSQDRDRSQDLTGVIRALQDAAVGPLPLPLADALRTLAIGLPAEVRPLETMFAGFFPKAL